MECALIRGEPRNPVVELVLVFFLSSLTCGGYLVYYWYRTLREVNAGLGREEFNVPLECVLSVLLCVFWQVWMMWRLCESVVELQRAWGVEPEYEDGNFFVLVLVLGPFFLQQSLNNAWENGSPGGAGDYGHAI